MNKELVSIIIPCYNHALFIEETLKSALNSSYPHIEIIIINDGSTDESESIALKYQMQYNNIKSEKSGTSNSQKLWNTDSKGNLHSSPGC